MSHDASGRTDTKRERKSFLNSLGKVSRDASGQTNIIKMKADFFFWVFLLFVIFVIL